MKKPFKNTELSSRKCKRCDKFLKLNLLAKKPRAELCYKDWRVAKLGQRRIENEG